MGPGRSQRLKKKLFLLISTNNTIKNNNIPLVFFVIFKLTFKTKQNKKYEDQILLLFSLVFVIIIFPFFFNN